MNKIPITILLGEDTRNEAFHHFLLVGFDFRDGGDGKVDVGLLQSSSDPMITLQGIQVLATQLAESEAADAKILGAALLKTIEHGLARLDAMRGEAG